MTTATVTTAPEDMPMAHTVKGPDGTTEAVVLRAPNFLVRAWRWTKQFTRNIWNGLVRAGKATVHGVKTGFNATSRVLVVGYRKSMAGLGWFFRQVGVRSYALGVGLAMALVIIVTTVIALPVNVFRTIWTSLSSAPNGALNQMKAERMAAEASTTEQANRAAQGMNRRQRREANRTAGRPANAAAVVTV